MAKAQYTAEFDKARKLWPGVKRGCNTELSYLKSKHRDWAKVIPLMYSAIEQQIIRHDQKANAYRPEFVPPWKNFKTWLFNRCWEETEGTEVDPKEEERKERMAIEREKQKGRTEYGQFFREKLTKELEGFLASDIDFYKYYSWLITEILSERK